MDFNGISQDHLFMYNGGMPQSLQTAPLGSASMDIGTEDLFLQHSPSQQYHGGFKRDENDDGFHSPSPPACKKQRIEIDRTPSNSTADDFEFASDAPIPPARCGISSFGEMDVLSGRGGGTNVHSGNRNFRDLINLHRRAYLKARKNDKPAISRKIVQAVRKNRGRFLKKDEPSGLWFEIGDAAAREKVAQALRQRAPEMRRLLFDSEKEVAHSSVNNDEKFLQQPVIPVRSEEQMGSSFQQVCDNQASLNRPSGSLNPSLFALNNKSPALPSDPYTQMFSAALLGNGINRFASNGA